jgi:hypothetical protein
MLIYKNLKFPFDFLDIEKSLNFSLRVRDI